MGNDEENSSHSHRPQSAPIPLIWVEYKRKLDRREREVRIKTRLIGLFVMLATWVNLIFLAVSLSEDCVKSIQW